MKPDEFITLSGRIVTFGAGGARSAISRAYYGSFHLAREVLASVGCSPTGGRSHSDLPNYLQCSTDEDAIMAGRILSDLHGSRVDADYRIGDTSIETIAFAQSRVEMAIEIQQRLVRFSETLKDSNTAQSLKNNIDELKRRLSGI